MYWFIRNTSRIAFSQKLKEATWYLPYLFPSWPISSWCKSHVPPYSNLLHAVLVHLLCDLLPQNQYLLFPVTLSCSDINTKDVHMKSLLPDSGIHTQHAYINSSSTGTVAYLLGIPSCTPCSLIQRLISQNQCLQSSFIDLFTQTSTCSHFDITQWLL